MEGSSRPRTPTTYSYLYHVWITIMSFFSEYLLPPLLLVGVNAAISGYTVLASLPFKNGTVSPVVFALLRDVVACACFTSSLLLSQRHQPPDERRLCPRVEHWGLFAALGLLGSLAVRGRRRRRHWREEIVREGE